MDEHAAGAARANGFLAIDWTEAAAPDGAAASCPNCGAPGVKPRVLDVSWIETRKEKPVRRRLFFCPACTCRYFGALKIPPYHDGLVIGWPELHAQQGAGLWSIDSPLARIRKPAGSRYLEIGCGYGFALDFARHARGWQALGIDPAPLAELGCRLLGADLRQGYFPEADPEIEPWDIMVATEVIEHLAHPADLLRDMRARLADDGVLLLTTPDGEAIRRETGEAALAQLLAPELHMVFQTAASLTRLLHEAGFAHVRIAQDATSLVAFASAAALDLDDDMPARRRNFLIYLAKRARETDEASDLGLGFAGRAMAEAVNDGDFALALEMRGKVWRGIATRFRLDLDRLDHLPPGMHGLPLQRLRFVMPFNMPTVLFAEAMRRLGQGARRSEVRRDLKLTVEAAALLIRALAALSLNDGMTEELSWQAQAELAIADAEAGAAAAVTALASLPRGDAGRHRQIAWRALIELVNTGAVDAARMLAARETLQAGEDALPAPLRRNGFVVLGQLALAEGGDPMQAVDAARQLGDDPVADELLLGGFTRLVNASRYDDADALRAEAARLAAARVDATGRDARLALAVLDLATGDPANVPSRIEGLIIEADRRAALLLGAFTRLVNLSRYREALDFAATHDIAAASAQAGPAARDARLALAVLDLAAGDPADVPARIEGLEIGERRPTLLLRAFTRLVNASRHDEAKALKAAHDIAATALARADDDARDARLALAVLDLAAGDPAQVARWIEGLDIADDRRRGLLLGAFTRLVNAGRYDEALALRQAALRPAWIADTANADGADAAFAAIMLELAAGDPALVPALLATLPHLPPPLREELLLQAFLRLTNAGRRSAARDMDAREDVEALALHASGVLRDDACLALLVLDIQPDGSPGRIAARLDRMTAAGVNAAPLQPLAMLAFVNLTNAEDFTAAEDLRPRIEPLFMNFAKATTPELRDAAYALGVLNLQEPPQPHRAEAAFSAVRRGFADVLAEGEAAPSLFWEALRGELVALHRMQRGGEAVAIARAMLRRHQGAPADMVADFDPAEQDAA